MKNTTTMFSFFLLLIALISNLPSTTLAQVILDSNGEVLQNGGDYYVVPSAIGSGGGLELAATGDDETCPTSVVQSPNKLSKGLPVRISSLFRLPYLRVDTPLTLTFTATLPTCAPSPAFWNVVNDQTQGPSVKITGYDDAVDGLFYIKKKSFRDYKLVFCVYSSDRCSDIGVHVDDDGNRLLVPTKRNPLSVKFQPVPYDSSSHEHASA